MRVPIRQTLCDNYLYSRWIGIFSIITLTCYIKDSVIYSTSTAAHFIIGTWTVDWFLVSEYVVDGGQIYYKRRPCWGWLLVAAIFSQEFTQCTYTYLHEWMMRDPTIIVHSLYYWCRYETIHLYYLYHLQTMILKRELYITTGLVHIGRYSSQAEEKGGRWWRPMVTR